VDSLLRPRLVFRHWPGPPGRVLLVQGSDPGRRGAVRADGRLHDSNYEQELIPGLLQTADYARAVIRAFRPDDTADEVTRRVEVRQARQEVFAREDPPRLWAVISEAVLRRAVGGPAVMAAQLRALASERDRAVVTVQVLPFSAGEHPAMAGSFVILDFPDPEPGAVYLENASSALYLERVTDVQRYAGMFRFVQAAALGPKESRDMLQAAAQELDS
jgi:hypothetical protein